jgi:hypothetical protein
LDFSKQPEPVLTYRFIWVNLPEELSAMLSIHFEKEPSRYRLRAVCVMVDSCSRMSICSKHRVFIGDAMGNDVEI